MGSACMYFVITVWLIVFSWRQRQRQRRKKPAESSCLLKICSSTCGWDSRRSLKSNVFLCSVADLVFCAVRKQQLTRVDVQSEVGTCNASPSALHSHSTQLSSTEAFHQSAAPCRVGNLRAGRGECGGLRRNEYELCLCKRREENGRCSHWKKQKEGEVRNCPLEPHIE